MTISFHRADYTVIRVLFIFGNTGFDRTNLSTLAAIAAEIRIYYITGIARLDGVVRAFGYADITHDAFIGYYISHSSAFRDSLDELIELPLSP